MATTSSRPAAVGLGINFALVIFVSAFLLFQVQPLISKFILPWFGGSPAVWTACMLFFQTLLFAGYAYAHFSVQRLSPARQGGLHLALLALAILGLAFLFPPSSAWKPADSSQPTLRIMLLLTASVGAPYFLLSATGPLLQAWFARSFPGRSPYRLYSLSNIGSLLALLSYPFWVEPRWDSLTQSNFWRIGFVLFAALCALAAMHVWRTDPRAVAVPDASSPSRAGTIDAAQAQAYRRQVDAGPPPWSHYLLWVALPAFASLMLLATTNHVCLDVAPTPFLWVVPLSLYLISFIIAFDHERWYVRPLFALAALVSIYLASGMGDFQRGKVAAYVKRSIEWYRNRQTATDSPLFKAGLEKLPGFRLGRMQALQVNANGESQWVDFGTDARPVLDPRTLPGFSQEDASLTLDDAQKLRWMKDQDLPEAAVDISTVRGYDIGSNQSLVHNETGRIGWLNPKEKWTSTDGDPRPYEWKFPLFDYRGELYVFFAALFCVCMICHGELVRLRPPPGHLTSFYLMISAGGAIGGLFVSLLAPQIFLTYMEFRIGLVGSALLASIALILSTRVFAHVGDFVGPNPGPEGWSIWRWGATLMLITVPVSMAAGASWWDVVDFQRVQHRNDLEIATPKPDDPPERKPGDNLSKEEEDRSKNVIVARARNFYGAVKVVDEDRDTQSPTRKLYNGRILHGLQFLDPQRSRLATTYYTPASGVGRAIGYFLHQPKMRVGAIGLGTGTLAAYSQEPGHYFRIYEINPEVKTLAEEQFKYLKQAAGPYDIVLGDARLSLEREAAEGSQQFDVLALDAFSGDAIPSHLLTKESFEIYKRHVDLKKGIIAVHISNKYLDLEPVVNGLADHFNVKTLRIYVRENDQIKQYASEWILMTNNQEFLDIHAKDNDPGWRSPEAFFMGHDEQVAKPLEMLLNRRNSILWTDAHSNLFEILN